MKTNLTDLSYIIGQILGIVIVGCLCALIIGISIKLLSWLL